MRRLIALLPLLAVLGCPNSQQVHLLTEAAPGIPVMQCAAARMTSLGYTVQDTVPTALFRIRSASKREGAIETVLTARLFEYEQTGVRRLAVRANQVRHSGDARAQPQIVSDQARADAQAIVSSCGTPEPGRERTAGAA